MIARPSRIGIGSRAPRPTCFLLVFPSICFALGVSPLSATGRRPAPEPRPASRLGFRGRGVRRFDLDLNSNVIEVRHGWDRAEGLIELKSKAGRRSLPLCQAAKRPLLEHLLATGRRDRPDAFVFGRKDTKAFTLDVPSRRAVRAWHAANTAVEAEAEQHGRD